MLDALGWAATALFASSYFFKTPRPMRRVQALAAIVWVAYGVWMSALPIVVANVIVATLALYSDWRDRRNEGANEHERPNLSDIGA